MYYKKNLNSKSETSMFVIFVNILTIFSINQQLRIQVSFWNLVKKLFGAGQSRILGMAFKSKDDFL